LVSAGGGWARVEAVVRSVFRLALRRPELLGLLREVSRLGPPPATRLTEALDPLVQRARLFLEAEMDNGTMRRQDARLVLLSAYSAVIAGPRWRCCAHRIDPTCVRSHGAASCSASSDRLDRRRLGRVTQIGREDRGRTGPQRRP
jgi:hypothetical protein